MAALGVIEGTAPQPLGDLLVRDEATPPLPFAAPEPPGAVLPVPLLTVPTPELGQILSPTQERTYLDCSARWWFKYGLGLPEVKNSSLALGSAVHHALEANFREKVET